MKKQQRFTRSAIALACASFLFPMSAAWADSAKLTFNGHSYQRFDTGMSWSAAKTFCESKGAHLATITSQAENDFLVANFVSSSIPIVLLGASDTLKEGVWQWVTGESWSYINWHSGEPNNGGGVVANENYLAFHSLNGLVKWNDIQATSNPALCEWDSTTTISTPTLTLSTPYGTSAGSTVNLSISPSPTGATYKFCISSVSQIINLGCQEVLSSSISIPLQPTWDYYLTAKTIVNGVESGLSNEVHVVTTSDTNDKLKYPVVFVHGLNSSHATWAAYGAGTAGYGGTLVAIDKFHATTTGNYSNKNVPQGNSQAGCPEEKDVTGLYDVRYYYGCKLQGDYFTMSFSNKNDLSFTAQAMELRAIVDAVTKLTGKPKVFLVGHSMGGLASRAYIQYLGGGSKVAGLITIGTPHQGSASLFSITPVPALITLTQSLSADVKAMLKPNSEDLNMLNDFTRNPWDTNVKTYAIALNGDTVTNSGDGVVAESSQRNSIFDNTLFKWDGITFRPNYTLPAFTFTFHEVETSDENIRAEVGRKLSQWSQIVP